MPVLKVCFPNRLGDVIFELVFTLNRVLRHVGIGAELDSARERDQRCPRAAVNQVVPVLETNRETVDQGRSQIGVQGQVGHLKVVNGEVSFGQIEIPVALVSTAVLACVETER